jgi:hypothetical protein
MGPQAAMFMNTPILKNMLFPEEQRGTIKTVKWDGMSFSGLLPYLESGEKAPVTATDLLSVGALEVLDQSVYINGKRAATTERTYLAPIEFVHFMPREVRMVSEGSTADLTAYVGDSNPEIVSILKNNKLDRVTGESEVLYTYDPKGGDVSLAMTGDAENFYELDFDLNITDFDYPAMAGGEGAGQAAMMQTAIEGMTLRLKDEKLLDTIFAVVGAATEQDPAQLRAQATGLVTLGAVQGGQISPRIPNYATAVSNFLSEGGTLEIRIAPENAVTLGQLQQAGGSNPGAVLDELNLTVERK